MIVESDWVLSPSFVLVSSELFVDWNFARRDRGESARSRVSYDDYFVAFAHGYWSIRFSADVARVCVAYVAPGLCGRYDLRHPSYFRGVGAALEIAYGWFR